MPFQDGRDPPGTSSVPSLAQGIQNNSRRFTKMKKIENFIELKKHLCTEKTSSFLIDDICLAHQGSNQYGTMMFDDRLGSEGKTIVRLHAKVGFVQVPEERSDIAMKYRRLERRKQRMSAA